MVFFTGKNGYTRPVDFLPVPDPLPAGTGRVRVYPRVRVDPHTSSIYALCELCTCCVCST